MITGAGGGAGCVAALEFPFEAAELSPGAAPLLDDWAELSVGCELGLVQAVPIVKSMLKNTADMRNLMDFLLDGRMIIRNSGVKEQLPTVQVAQLNNVEMNNGSELPFRHRHCRLDFEGGVGVFVGGGGLCGFGRPGGCSRNGFFFFFVEKLCRIQKRASE
jgi:hypothetical protein